MSDHKNDDTKGAKTPEKPPEKAQPKPMTRTDLEAKLTILAGKGAAISRAAKRGLEVLRDEHDVDVSEVHASTAEALAAILDDLKKL